MSSIVAVLIQIGLIFGPVLLFFLLRSKFSSCFAAVLFAFALATITGGFAYYFASEHEWLPVTKSGRVSPLSPSLLGSVFLVGIFVVLSLFILVKPSVVGSSKKERGWRVGHTGRDSMYYEEHHAGTWQRIRIDGEMLMGPAHHVIYFASIEQWANYPEWARGRRDEIIARIKSEFLEPDYEYYGA